MSQQLHWKISKRCFRWCYTSYERGQLIPEKELVESSTKDTIIEGINLLKFFSSFINGLIPYNIYLTNK